ncbi:hypothetical protein Tco_0846489 [Tanacetum coccineum]
MKQDKAQQAARDEKLVPSDDRFDIDNKTCQIDVELFKEILDICPRVQNQEFTVPPFSDSLLEFLLDLGYKAYKTFFGISTGLIPSKKGIGKGAHETKALVVSKKTTATSKKKQSKRKLKPPSVPAKKTQESSGKLKGIELLSDAAQLELETHRAIKARRCESKFQHQTRGSSKGAGIRLEVPDEPSDKSADSDKGVGTSPEVSDKSEDKKEEDDASIDIEKIDDERINTDVEDQVKDVVEMNVAEEADEENTKRVEEQKEDEELKINSLSDVQIQQDVPNIQQEPFHAVKVSVIPKTTQQPPFTPPAPPPPATEIPSTQFSNSKAVKSIVQSLTELEQIVKELKQADHSTTFLASIRSQVPSIVKEYLGSNYNNP